MQKTIYAEIVHFVNTSLLPEDFELDIVLKVQNKRKRIAALDIPAALSLIQPRMQPGIYGHKATLTAEHKLENLQSSQEVLKKSAFAINYFCGTEK